MLSSYFIMASRYIQEFPIPNDFTSIFKNLTKEILRDQPANITHYAACYFHALDQQESFKYDPEFRFDQAGQPAAPPQPSKEQGEQSAKQEMLQKVVEQTIEEVYNEYDKNKDGSLDLQELRKMVSAFKEKGVMELEKDPTEQELKGLLGELDSNGNGRVEKQEFKTFIKMVIRTVI